MKAALENEDIPDKEYFTESIIKNTEVMKKQQYMIEKASYDYFDVLVINKGFDI